MEIALEIKKNSKTLEDIIDFYINKILQKTEKNELDEALNNFKELAKNYLTEDKVLEAIENAPECLFEFFDKENLFITIDCEKKLLDNVVLFQYKIYNTYVKVPFIFTDKSFISRKEANAKCILKAVEMLNEYNIEKK